MGPPDAARVILSEPIASVPPRKPVRSLPSPVYDPPDRPAVGDVFAMPMPSGRTALVQVIAHTGQRVELVALDRIVEGAATLDAARGAGVLRIDHHANRGDDAWWSVSSTPPPGALRLGNLSPVRTYDRACTSEGGWENAVWIAASQLRWDRDLTDDERAGLRAPGRPVHLDLGDRPRSIDSATHWLSIGPRGGVHFTIKEFTPIPWDALDAVQGLTEIHYTGTDRGFEDYLRRRRTIDRVVWHGHGRARIDLRGTLIERLVLSTDATPLELALPGSILSVDFLGPCAELRVTDGDPAFAPAVSMQVAGALPPAVKGLERLTSLVARGVRDADLRRLAPYASLERLTIHGDRATLRNLGALAALRSLRALELQDCDPIRVDEFPGRDALPSLARVSIRGMLKDDVATLRARLEGVATVDLQGARSAAWIEAHRSDPFREWEEAGATFGRAASAAWRAAVLEAAKLGPSASASEAREALRRFVEALNALDARRGAIDTIRGEQAAEAFARLAAKFDAVPAEDAHAWFDAWRSF